MMITINQKILKYILYIQSKDEESLVKQAFLMSFDLHCNGKNSFHSHLMNMSEYFKLPDFNPDLLDIAMVKSYVSSMKQEYISYWQNTLQHSQKLEFYRSFKSNHTTSSYLDLTRNKFYYKVKTLIPNITELPINGLICGLINELMNSSNYLEESKKNLFQAKKQNMWKWKSARPTNTRKAGYAHAVIQTSYSAGSVKDATHSLFLCFKRFEFEYDTNKCARVFFFVKLIQANWLVLAWYCFEYSVTL